MEQPRKKLGIANLKITMLFLIVFANTFGKALEDKKISLTEIMLFFPLLKDISKFFKSLKDSALEILDLDLEEKNELVLFFVEKFDLPNEDTEKLVEKLFGFVLTLVFMILSVRELFEKKQDKLEDIQGLSVSIKEYQNLRVAG